MQYYGQWPEYRVDRYLHETFFHDGAPGFFIEAGANDGLLDPCCLFFERHLGWRGINVEGERGLFDRLALNRPTAINEWAALTDPERSRQVGTFYKVNHPHYGYENGMGSMTPSQLEFIQRHGCKWEQEPVPLLSYRDLLAKHGVEHVDLFCLDVEGGELDVITGMAGAPLPRVFCVEYDHLTLPVVKAKVEPLGFTFHSTSYNNAYFLLD